MTGTMMDLNLSSRRVLVTAGAAGIGRVIAQRFRPKARVAVCDVDDGALADCSAQASRVKALRADALSRRRRKYLCDVAAKLRRSRRIGEQRGNFGPDQAGV